MAGRQRDADPEKRPGNPGKVQAQSAERADAPAHQPEPGHRLGKPGGKMDQRNADQPTAKPEHTGPGEHFHEAEGSHQAQHHGAVLMGGEHVRHGDGKPAQHQRAGKEPDQQPFGAARAGTRRQRDKGERAGKKPRALHAQRLAQHAAQVTAFRPRL